MCAAFVCFFLYCVTNTRQLHRRPSQQCFIIEMVVILQPTLQHYLFHLPIWRKFDVAVGFIPKSHNLLLLNIPNPHFFSTLHCTSSKKWTHQRDASLGEVENEVGTDDEVTSTAKSPAEAKELFAKTEQFAKLRYEGYKKLSEEK